MRVRLTPEQPAGFGALPNSTWNYNSHETTTFGCPSSTHRGPKVWQRPWNDDFSTVTPPGHHWEANVALTTTAKLQRLRVNSREMTTFARIVQRPRNATTMKWQVRNCTIFAANFASDFASLRGCCRFKCLLEVSEVSRTKKFMCSRRNPGNINFCFWLTVWLSQGQPPFQTIDVFKVHVPFSCLLLSLLDAKSSLSPPPFIWWVLWNQHRCHCGFNLPRSKGKEQQCT